jgi:hypothetical protein
MPKLHLQHKDKIHAHRGQIQKVQEFSIRRTRFHRILLSLDASHVITPRAFRIEASRRAWLPPVRPVKSTGQTGPAQSRRHRVSGLGCDAPGF